MKAKDISNENFQESLNEVEPALFAMSFSKHSFLKKGYAYFAKYEKGDSIVEFMYGPSDYHVEMLIYNPRGKFAFRDLLELPSIASWVNGNKDVQMNKENIKNELLWFIKLLKFVLPII